MKKDTYNVKDMGYFWKVELLDPVTYQPYTWVNVDKEEFPTEKEALDYLIKRYESKSRKTIPVKSTTKRTLDKKHFIQPAIERELKLGHKGMTHKLLGLPKNYNLSHAETLMQKIVDTSIGKKIKNPLKHGKKYYIITTDLKHHVNFALNLIRINEKKKWCGCK